MPRKLTPRKLTRKIQLLQTLEEWCERHQDSGRAAILILAFLRGHCHHAYYYPDTQTCDLCDAPIPGH